MYAQEFIIQIWIFYTSWVESDALPFVSRKRFGCTRYRLRGYGRAADFDNVSAAVGVFNKAETVHAGLEGANR